jgi:hypothetical protein
MHGLTKYSKKTSNRILDGDIDQDYKLASIYSRDSNPKLLAINDNDFIWKEQD